MRLILLLVVLSISSLGYSQKVTDTTFYPDGKVKSISWYDKAEAGSGENSLGTFKEIGYYKSGMRKYMKRHDNLHFDVEEIDYYENGKASFTCRLEDNNKQGEVLGYHENGDFAYRYYYVDGQREGESVSYFENGVLK